MYIDSVINQRGTMSYSRVAGNPKIIQPVEAEPGAWKNHITGLKHVGTVMKGAGLFALAAGIVAGGAPILGGAVVWAGAHFTASVIKGMQQADARTDANIAAANRQGLPREYAKNTSVMGSIGKNLLKPF